MLSANRWGGTLPFLAGLSGRVPVHLIWGEADASVSPDYGRQAHSEIPLSTLRFVAGAGHLPYFEKPEEVNRLLDRLLIIFDVPAVSQEYERNA